jgi:hypothetical protein
MSLGPNTGLEIFRTGASGHYPMWVALPSINPAQRERQSRLGLRRALSFFSFRHLPTDEYVVIQIPASWNGTWCVFR